MALSRNTAALAVVYNQEKLKERTKRKKSSTREVCVCECNAEASHWRSVQQTCSANACKDG